MLKLVNMAAHFSQEFAHENSDFRSLAKGRKRKNCTKCRTMNTFLEQDVLPAWKENLTNISQRQRAMCIKQGRMTYAIKEFCKDIRNFYRIMFRLRFHRSDKRLDGNNNKMIKGFLNELGMIYEESEITDDLFTFFYKVHFNQRKLQGRMDLDAFVHKQKPIDNEFLFKQ